MPFSNFLNRFRLKTGWEIIDVEGRKVSVLDCREFVLGRLSFTKEKALAEKFVRGRSWTGDGLEGQMPDKSVKFQTELRAPNNGGAKIPEGPLFKAATMEDKFDIYNFAQSFFVCRSWTSDLCLRGDYTYYRDESLIFKEIYVSPSLGESLFVRRYFEFLIKSHCLDMICPHPIGKDVRRRNADIAAYSFSQFGRRGWYATYDETIGIYGRSRYNFAGR